jgi:hypothetical protein
MGCASPYSDYSQAARFMAHHLPAWFSGAAGRRPLTADGVAEADVRATLKLAPSLPIPVGTASGWLEPLSMVMGCAPAWVRSTVCPF